MLVGGDVRVGPMLFAIAVGGAYSCADRLRRLGRSRLQDRIRTDPPERPQRRASPAGPRTGRPHALSGQPRRSGASGAAARGRRRLSDALLGLASQAGAAESAPPPSDAALTHGETRALHYLPTNLSAREIAGELYLSVNTVETQQHLYQNSARAAVPRPSSRPAPSACSHHSSRRRR